MIDLNLTDVRPFIDAKDSGTSRAFYEALGWNVEHLDDQRVGWVERSDTHRSSEES